MKKTRKKGNINWLGIKENIAKVQLDIDFNLESPTKRIIKSVN